MQTPQYRVDSLDALLNLPVASTGGTTATAAANSGSTQLLGNLVEVAPGRQPAIASRYNILPVTLVYQKKGTQRTSTSARRLPPSEYIPSTYLSLPIEEEE